LVKLTCFIPSYKDPLLANTIMSLLENSELPKDELEVIAVIDGYEPDFELPQDPRVKYIRQENTGMRGAINTAVNAAQGEYILRTDEHCMFCKGYDRILLENIEDNWIVTPTRYCLDPIKWEVMDMEPVNFAKLVIAGTSHERKKFAAVRWRSRDEQMKDVMIAETMGMQGSCWIMKKSWWDKVIVKLEDEGYGTHYQDSIEMIFKTWKAGGKMMLNKNAWYAHKHRNFKRTHNYGGDLANASFTYAIDTWKDYYVNEIRPKWFK
jgi:glycosyltransferase involved in cell wall biosynthesis